MEVDIYLASKNTSFSTFQQVEVLFKQLYEGMEKQGLSLNLQNNGPQIWIRQLKKSLGKFQVLVIAEELGSVIGFGVGAIRLAPDYLEIKKVGLITHINITPEKRRNRIGRKIVHELEAWFSENKVDSIELEVLVNNESGEHFWGELGYQKNLIKMKKIAGNFN
ncbi:MAG: hypothetical protein CL402_00320 [Acidiferrobacteraceae bacterium]|nr:hypothetical protein [Acidiferrobacteraceae bacterium]|tara:strand:+ start:98 stop:589 length:492 start_codon:yes stop_codon:yes gene_type:complete